VKTSSYSFDPVRAGAILASWGTVSDDVSGYKYVGSDVAQGLIGTLATAEELAAAAGVAKYVDLGSGDVLVLGAARDQVRSSSDDAVRTLYLASYGAVRAIHDAAKLADAQASNPPIGGFGPAPGYASDREIGFPIIPIVLAVVGIAGLIAGAWYATTTHIAAIEVAGHNARQATLANSYTAIGAAALKAGQPIPDSVWAGLKSLAEQEAEHSGPWPYVLGGGIVLGAVAGGIYLAAKYGGPR